LNSDEECN